MDKSIKFDPNDIIGKKIGNLTVLKYLGRKPSQKHIFKDWHKFKLYYTYKVKCSCGEYSFIPRKRLIGKKHISKCKYCCNKSHNFSKSRTYKSWRSIKYRHILDGIKICKRWEKFENFLEDMGKRPQYKILMRKNLDKGFNKKNCRWGTIKEVNQNNKNCNLIKINKIKKSLRAWFFHFGFTEGQYNWYRVKKNKTPLRKLFKLKNTDTIIEHYKYQK